MIESLEVAWFRYNVPLHRPIVLAGLSVTSREGFVVRVQSEDGAEGWGEAAPLPGFHGWCPPDQLVDSLRTLSTDPSTGGAGFAIPSVGFAMTSALEWLADNRGDRARETKRRFSTTFLVNRQDRTQDVQKQVALFNSVKIKVGGDIYEDASFIKKIRDAVSPETKIRADANRLWTFDQALAFGQLIGADTLEFLEEPCKDHDSFSVLREKTGLRIAADESIQEADNAASISKILDSVDYVVLKPTMIGGLDTCRALAKKVYSHNSGVVVSSAYETGIGMRGLLMLIRSLRPSDPAPGIGTYASLKEDTLTERLPVEGPVVDLVTALKIKDVKLDSLERVL